MSSSSNKAYAQAGVDIDLADTLKGNLKKELSKASRPEVIGGLGGFGGLFDFTKLAKKYKEPVLVSSVDGVGTKLQLAISAGKNLVVGEDIVNHCLNDIAVCGAEPLFFLDYVGMGKLDPAIFHEVLGGMSKACQQGNCALIGGETAQMPGFYKPGEYELVGSVVGVVEKKKILTGKAVKPGDLLIGLPSSGLHTNGYTLATRIFFTKLRYRMDDVLPGTKKAIADALLEPHLNYSNILQVLLGKLNKGDSAAKRKGNAIFAACHITGGGFPGNLPRILPDKCGAVIHTRSWKKSALFNALETQGGVLPEELYEVFNMGIGLVLVVDPEQKETVGNLLDNQKQRYTIIGEVTKDPGKIDLQ
ncbi:MAG: phosphoribosylformylglycinamidine cyclo-ligase [Opitutales bacterium]|nr:phosphoribosylformylglycinamidine cyclo-ligase [Opitutales bacterium]MCH8540062.1 phosphoribosylformylglycinamidine cyclo-ligase [Opitutales bacterium]